MTWKNGTLPRVPAPPSQTISGTTRPYWTPAEIPGCPFGRLVCSVCAGPPTADALESLILDERRYAEGLESEARSREWIGGRLCLAGAVALLSAARQAMLPDAAGAPTVPAGIAASISHKGPLAVALAATTRGGVGIDVECVGLGDTMLESKVLTASERMRLDGREPFAAAVFVVAHFALKESIYKALTPADQAELEFDDIELTLPALMERTWLEVAARLVRRPSTIVRAALLVDDEWMIAAAERDGSRA